MSILQNRGVRVLGLAAVLLARSAIGAQLIISDLNDGLPLVSAGPVTLLLETNENATGVMAFDNPFNAAPVFSVELLESDGTTVSDLLSLSRIPNSNQYNFTFVSDPSNEATLSAGSNVVASVIEDGTLQTVLTSFGSDAIILQSDVETTTPLPQSAWMGIALLAGVSVHSLYRRRATAV